jgi:hypothetical protein
MYDHKQLFEIERILYVDERCRVFSFYECHSKIIWFQVALVQCENKYNFENNTCIPCVPLMILITLVA